MPDDTSKTRALDCKDLTAGGNFDISERLYSAAWKYTDKRYITTLYKEMLQCDDKKTGSDPGYDNYGTWMFFVR